MWPESSESLPKQFIPLIGRRSTFQSIVTVVADPDVFGPVVVVTNFDDRFRVAEQSRKMGAEAAILLEPGYVVMKRPPPTGHWGGRG